MELQLPRLHSTPTLALLLTPMEASQKMGKRPFIHSFTNITSASTEEHQILLLEINETGRLSLKFNILPRIITFWLHLASLPEDIVAKQCLDISNQLANEAKSMKSSKII